MAVLLIRVLVFIRAIRIVVCRRKQYISLAGKTHARVRFHITRNARIYNIGKYQSCMVSKLREETFRNATATATTAKLL